jgi:hypothetical protein
MNRFDKIMNFEDETLISNRIKILIKNMFSNKEDGWAKTAEMHKGGPKKKLEVQQEVENKYKAEEKARNAGQSGRYNNDRRDGGGGGYNNDRDRKQGGGGYGNDRNDRNDRDRRDGGGGKQETNRYQKKDTQGAGG